ncbi:MAG: hypothetical protein J6X44_06905, partial [Thermoguttaceae bacterium]|nr:hypothetical protein [Thermoguttaceae bacterium]
SYLTKLDVANPPKTTILINNESNIYTLPSTFDDDSRDIANTKTTTTRPAEGGEPSAKDDGGRDMRTTAPKTTEKRLKRIRSEESERDYQLST